MTDEMMAERRRLFLEEMARIREREQQAQENTRTAALTLPSVETIKTPVRRFTHVSWPRAELLVLMALCLALTFPVFGYIRREAKMPVAGQDDESWRLDHLQRARAFFSLPDIISVQRDEFGPSLLLRPGLSNAQVIAHARHIRDTLSVQSYPTRGFQPWRIDVCSADVPCRVAIVRTSASRTRSIWRVTDGDLVIK